MNFNCMLTQGKDERDENFFATDLKWYDFIEAEMKDNNKSAVVNSEFVADARLEK